MRKFLIFVSVVMCGFVVMDEFRDRQTGAPPNGVAEEEVPQILGEQSWFNWKRPAGRAKVALQAGHWRNDEFPEELEKLRGNGGASGSGKSEWEVNLVIAQETKRILQGQGVEVEVLPATIPPRYWADVFVAIHADGSTDPNKSGYKFAGPWRDVSRKSSKLVAYLDRVYGEVSGLEYDANISRNMRGYYAFSWWKYEHALHPMTTGVIAETGFLTSAKDRELIVEEPEAVAGALAKGIVEYLKSEELL